MCETTISFLYLSGFIILKQTNRQIYLSFLLSMGPDTLKVDGLGIPPPPPHLYTRTKKKTIKSYTISDKILHNIWPWALSC